MTVVVTGTYEGRKVRCEKTGTKIKGDRAILSMAGDDIKEKLTVAPHPTLPVVIASFSTDLAFVVTIINVLDPGTHKVKGFDLPKLDPSIIV